MKAILRVSILLSILCAAYIMIKGSELLTMDYLGEAREIEDQAELLTKELENVEEAITDEKITCDTVYTVSEYDLSTGREEQHQESLPASYIGMSRAQLIDWIDDYNRSASLEDLESGFQSMELVSFSKEEIKVRKRVESQPKEPEERVKQEPLSSVSEKSLYYGCILAQDGLLTVYDGDRRHVIQYTDISLFDLSEELQQEILDGKFVTSEEELYQLLESYSS